MTVVFRPMVAEDALIVQRQASQRVQLGIEPVVSLAHGRELAERGEAWTATVGDRIVACIGLLETFPGRQAVAWAIIAEGIGAAHLAVTRFARKRIAVSPLARIEAIVRADVRPECTWARLLGLEAAHVLRKFGGASETHVLYERVR